MPDREIVSELERIKEQSPTGTLLPKDVVDRARDVKSPLHDYFEWDDSKAAQQHRLDQARHLIRVCVRVEPATKRMTRVFMSLPSDRKDGRGYRDTVEIMSDARMRDELLDNALDDLERMEAKYAGLRALERVFTEVRKVKRRRNAAAGQAAQPARKRKR